jgi:hypothetical protein
MYIPSPVWGVSWPVGGPPPAGPPPQECEAPFDKGKREGGGPPPSSLGRQAKTRGVDPPPQDMGSKDVKYRLPWAGANGRCPPPPLPPLGVWWSVQVSLSFAGKRITPLLAPPPWWGEGGARVVSLPAPLSHGNPNAPNRRKTRRPR